MIVGQGDYRYELVVGWGKGQQGYTLGMASGVATDSQDRVYVVDREPHPAIVVFDREGHFLSAWGQPVLSLPHEIWISPDDRLYIADCGNHTVRVFTPDGELLQTLGTSGQAGAFGQPFNMPTRAVVSPSGEMYVSDGYRQYHIHRFSSAGTLLQTWGGQGSEAGEFTLPHNIFVAPDGRVVVADRESNNRMQVFTADGKFLSQWLGRLVPCGLYIDADGIVYIAEGGGVSIFNLDGQLLSCFKVAGGPDDVNHGAHGIWVDRHGDIYVGEVGALDLLHKFKRV
jgi:DNA-binding beta-propeller fold protein YncE